ncbi:hypothetical protein [Spiroplasma endosymbiont of Poecilobothrus nobilitatus]|uniref:hypothetical protein n=1 Tax=Spiroplasma endosymbiont of Poecilobothrus nobilitatus TaxID=1209220 RepID=UPI00313BCE1E
MKFARSTYYYQLKANNPKNTKNIDNAVISIFLKSRKNYGTRKIKVMEWQHFLGHFLYRHLFYKSNWR